MCLGHTYIYASCENQSFYFCQSDLIIVLCIYLFDCLKLINFKADKTKKKVGNCAVQNWSGFVIEQFFSSLQTSLHFS